MLAGPLAWAALLETNYVLSYVACEQRQTWVLHVATVVALAVTAAGAYSAWSAAPPRQSADAPSTSLVDGTDTLARFMAVGGLALSVSFAIVILATHLPAMILDPCTQ